jgi:SAM-dependent MidA family methyltransferase
MSAPGRSAPLTDADRREKFRRLLLRVAARDGFVPFDRFMEVALYGEEVGYYSRTDSPFGREGDYYTAAHASPLFGRTIAERVRAVLADLPPGVPARVVEVGPGDGTLGEGVVSGLAAEPGIPEQVEYVLVERSPSLSRRGFDRVSAAGKAVGVPVRLSDGIGADGPFRGVVLANELLDAQPARRLLWDGRDWNETGVRVTDHKLLRATVPCDRPVPPPELPTGLPEGTILEVSPMAEALVREVADHLVSGLGIFLDYGMDESELVAGHPSGTLAAVRKHRSVDDPLDDPGSSDLSVFVNFRRIRAVARSSGLREVAFRRQGEALHAWGLPKLLEEAVRSAPSSEAQVRTHLAAKNLLFGFERFYSLELAPPSGPDAPASDPVK